MIEIKEYTVIDLDRHDNDYIRNCWLHIENYLAECGMKEIGIRKVLGAGVGSLFGLLTAEFLKLIYFKRMN